MRFRDNDVVSTDSKMELVLLEILIIKIEDNSSATKISNDADIAVITTKNNDLMLVMDKLWRAQKKMLVTDIA